MKLQSYVPALVINKRTMDWGPKSECQQDTHGSQTPQVNLVWQQLLMCSPEWAITSIAEEDTQSNPDICKSHLAILSQNAATACE